MADFLGLAALITYELGHKELIIIGLGRMKGSHDAENIKKTVEHLINAHDFYRSKINCKLYYN